MYCTMAAGAMRRAGPRPEKNTEAPSLRSIVMAWLVMPAVPPPSALFSCMRVFTTSTGDDTTVAQQ